MYLISPERMLFFVAFSTLGLIVTVVLFIFTVIVGLKSYREFSRIRCYRCGYSEDPTVKVGEGYYCKFCIGAGYVERGDRSDNLQS